MIRDVIIHMQNEQPLKADVEQMPTPADSCLMCTNLRYLNGKKPGWSDRTDSWFMIPMTMIRFVEVPQSSLSGAEGSLPLGIIPVSDGEPPRLRGCGARRGPAAAHPRGLTRLTTRPRARSREAIGGLTVPAGSAVRRC